MPFDYYFFYPFYFHVLTVLSDSTPPRLLFSPLLYASWTLLLSFLLYPHTLNRNLVLSHPIFLTSPLRHSISPTASIFPPCTFPTPCFLYLNLPCLYYLTQFLTTSLPPFPLPSPSLQNTPSPPNSIFSPGTFLPTPSRYLTLTSRPTERPFPPFPCSSVRMNLSRGRKRKHCGEGYTQHENCPLCVCVCVKEWSANFFVLFYFFLRMASRLSKVAALPW